MAILNPGGLIIDVYGEHIRNLPATYTAPVSDDFNQNAVSPQTPYNPGGTRCPAYGSQQTVRTWQEQLHELRIQT